MGYRTETRTITRDVKAIVGAQCDVCHAELAPAMPVNDGVWHAEQPEHALELRLIGFYGGYFDADESPLIVLCKECADRLCEQWPVFREAIRGVFAWMEQAYGEKS